MLHTLPFSEIEAPKAFTFPFCYTPHSLAVKAMESLQKHLAKYCFEEGKMFGVLVVETAAKEYAFLAAFSGQFQVAEKDDFFVPPVFDYSNPECHFQLEQHEIVLLNKRIETFKQQREYVVLEHERKRLLQLREEGVEKAQQQYVAGKMERDKKREKGTLNEDDIKQSQYQKAEVVRAKKRFAKELEALEQQKQQQDKGYEQLLLERKERSEQLQQWLFERTLLLNARGERKSLPEIFIAAQIPSGAGECCAPKLLQEAYTQQLKPLCMAEFWWGPASQNMDRLQGECYAACHRKCGPILAFMLQGLDVEADPTAEYNGFQGTFSVLWEDEHIAVIVKPAGMLTTPGKANVANVFDEALRRWPQLEPPVIVHRLDMDTSGVMVLAKTQRAYHALQKDFAARKIKKEYLALLEGTPARKKGKISLPLAPDMDDLPRQQVCAEGLEAETDYEIMETTSQGTRVRFSPLTGRTHQLRLHAAHPLGLNAPIVGDRLYGHVDKRLYLHAETLAFEHPITHEKMTFTNCCPF